MKSKFRFDLSEVQLREVKASLAKFEAAHRARVAWFDDYSLNSNVLSIHALDLLTILSHCQRGPENEMDLFRLRRAAMDELSLRLERTQDEIKRQNIRMWVESFRSFGLGRMPMSTLRLHHHSRAELSCFDPIPIRRGARNDPARTSP